MTQTQRVWSGRQRVFVPSAALFAAALLSSTAPVLGAQAHLVTACAAAFDPAAASS